MKIHKLDAGACVQARARLADLLQDAVAGGAALGHASGLGALEAGRYWDGVAAGLRENTRVLLVASHEGTLAGAVQLALCQGWQNAHRAELQKMMVHSRARRRGLGSVLLRAVEAEALALGRHQLHLELEAGSGAEQLYHGLGYTRAGAIPGFAFAPNGSLRTTSIYYKSLLPTEVL